MFEYVVFCIFSILFVSFATYFVSIKGWSFIAIEMPKRQAMATALIAGGVVTIILIGVAVRYYFFS